MLLNFRARDRVEGERIVDDRERREHGAGGRWDDDLDKINRRERKRRANRDVLPRIEPEMRGVLLDVVAEWVGEIVNGREVDRER